MSFVRRRLISGAIALASIGAMSELAPSLAVAAGTDRRVALVIGNAAYAQAGRLASPPNNAKAMAKLFTDAGFTSAVAKTDLGIDAFRGALTDFAALARGADAAIIYYSGRGFEHLGESYLVPVDGALDRDVDTSKAVPLDLVVKAVAGAKRLKLILLDASRNDPFEAASRTTSVRPGLARVEPAETDLIIAYAARAGMEAEDGGADGTSPYTAALLKWLTVPGLDIELALRHARDEVVVATQNGQQPFYNGALSGAGFALAP